MKRFHVALLLSSALGVATFACGGISDPTIGSERVATVSGALTGTAVPANARVALVYRKFTAASHAGAPTVEVASDTAVVGGKFTMNLTAPSADYFSAVDGKSFDDSNPPQVGDVAAPEPAPAPSGASGGGSSSGGAGGFAGNVGTQDIVSGGITQQMTAAVAGFVVYADSNGNGKLDLEGEYASTPDQILGGNKELVLVFLQDGGALDYEKMRDKSGIVPTAGFNLAWTEGRWLPLNVVELKLSDTARLPGPVCASDGYAYASGSGGSGGASTTTPAMPKGEDPSGGSSSGGGSSGGGSTIGGYPSPTDPNLECSPDGRSFMYSPPNDCPPYTPQPKPVGLCASGYDYDETAPCARGGYGSSLTTDQPVPEGWPCTVGSADGGVDGGDGGADGGDGGADAGADAG